MVARENEARDPGRRIHRDGNRAHSGTERRGVGLHNTSERLAVLYGENRRFTVSNSHPGLRVDMALPLEGVVRNDSIHAAAVVLDPDAGMPELRDPHTATLGPPRGVRP